jgi:hypothetical protein
MKSPGWDRCLGVEVFIYCRFKGLIDTGTGSTYYRLNYQSRVRRLSGGCSGVG